MEPEQLSRELREGESADLTRRRWIVGLSLIGAAMGQVVSLYQMGIVNHLPDPPLPIFNSDKVDASAYAYSRFSTPDALMMVANYGVTASLAGAGGKGRAEERPLLPILMGAKILGDVVTALELAREEWRDNRALCAYCQLATLVSIASLIIAIPEVRRAVRAWRGQR